MLDTIANNVENEIKKSNDIDVEKSNYKCNLISNVLSLDSMNDDSAFNKNSNYENIHLKDEVMLVSNKNTYLGGDLINPEIEECLSEESDIDGTIIYNILTVLILFCLTSN